MKYTQLCNPAKYSIILGTMLLVTTGCGSSSTDGTIDTSTSDLALFADTPSVREQFGTRTVRDIPTQADEITSTAVVNALNDFSFDLHRSVIAERPDQGSIESGYSAALALLLASAATGGDTLVALNNLLGVDSLVEEDVHNAINTLSLLLEGRSNDNLDLHTANRLFIKSGLDLQTEFLDTATTSFGAPVTEADFETATEEVTAAINEWVANQTNNFIPTIIDEIDPNTAVAVLNAIFLDARWRDDYNALGDQAFNAIDGTITSVPSFGGSGLLPQRVDSTLTAVEIPYAGEDLAMLILMPDSLESFEASLDAETLTEVVDSLEFADVRFTVPSWQLESELDLVQLLTPLGLPGNPWDFSRLVAGGDPLEVIARQNAKIEVDESGTIAAAATVVGGFGTTTSIPPPITVIEIDRPFVYVLRDIETGTVLFTGRIVAP